MIKKGHTAYHVESGDFVPSRDIARTLFRKDGGLKGGIRHCLDNGGTLVVILTGPGGSDVDAEGLEERFAKVLADRNPEYAGSPIKVWIPGRIRSLIDRHPHLSLFVTGTPAGLYTHDKWASHPDMRSTAHLGPEQHRFIDELQKCLRAGGGEESLLVQVTGAPGAGKTRLVLEATRGEAYSRRIVYVSWPDMLAPLLDHVAVSESGFSNLVIVIDNCTRLEQGRIWYEAMARAGMKAVTISGEPGEGGINVRHLPVPDHGDAQIGQIISEYAKKGEDIAGWIDYARPSPQAAHMAGESLRKSHGVTSSQPGIVPVWKMYIEGQHWQGPPDAETRMAVMMWLSLFRDVRLEGGRGRELECVAALAEEYHNIGMGQFMDAVKRLRAMKVLQGESEIHIAPKILHLHTWARWWRTYTAGMAPSPDRLVRGGSQRLFQSYIDMFKYAKDSPEAAQIVRDMLAPGGFLEFNKALKSRLGADFFGA